MIEELGRVLALSAALTWSLWISVNVIRGEKVGGADAALFGVSIAIFAWLMGWLA